MEETLSMGWLLAGVGGILIVAWHSWGAWRAIEHINGDPLEHQLITSIKIVLFPLQRPTIRRKREKLRS